MEKLLTRILIVDDHPMTVDGYVSLLAKPDRETEFVLCYSCAEAYWEIINFENRATAPNIAFVDLNLPAFEEKNIHSGTDIAMLLRQKFPLCKVVIISMHSEPVWVNEIFKSIAPEGFISKSDINYESFPEVFETILAGENYISASIEEARRLFLKRNIQWDALDSKILKLIADGVKTRNLPNFIGLSLSTIEKRKAGIKRQLVLDDGSDAELIEAARKLGLI